MPDVNIVPVCHLTPGRCFACGNSGNQHSWFVDTGVDVDGMNAPWRLYVCDQCFGHWAALTGFVPRQLVEELTVDLGEAQLVAQELRDRLAAADETTVRVVPVDELLGRLRGERLVAEAVTSRAPHELSDRGLPFAVEDQAGEGKKQRARSR